MKIEKIKISKVNINQVLKLMVLLSKTNDGLSSNDYNQLTNQFLHVKKNITTSTTFWYLVLFWIFFLMLFKRTTDSIKHSCCRSFKKLASSSRTTINLQCRRALKCQKKSQNRIFSKVSVTNIYFIEVFCCCWKTKLIKFQNLI